MPTESYSLSMEVVQIIEKISQEKGVPKSRIVDSALRRALAIEDKIKNTSPVDSEPSSETIEEKKPTLEDEEVDPLAEPEGSEADG